MTAGRGETTGPPPRGLDLLSALRVRNVAPFWTGQLIPGRVSWTGRTSAGRRPTSTASEARTRRKEAP